MTDTDKLRATINSRGLKIKYIAEKLGITPYCLNKKMNNVSEFKGNEVGTICDILNITDSSERDDIFFTKKVDKK